MERLPLVLARLHQIKEADWINIMQVCRRHIHRRIPVGQRYRGAHNEQRLGMAVFDYYFGEAVGKLYLGEWNWQFERFTLLEQLIRIIDSLISHQVEKYMTAKAKSISFEYRESLFEAEAMQEPPPEILEDEPEAFQMQLLEEVAAQKPGWSDLLTCLKKGLKPTAIAEHMNKEVRDIYKITEMFYAKARRVYKASISSLTAHGKDIR
ncbi:MAG: hypothetical protein EOP06_20870 [Proteobacteria bacterium]|nr:MAG: hypothetical protein EOP06_20870 [Pseudomonadota bacterium]